MYCYQSKDGNKELGKYLPVTSMIESKKNGKAMYIPKARKRSSVSKRQPGSNYCG